MLSRRSIFSLFSAGVAIAAGAKVVEAAPAPSEINDMARRMWVASSDPTPRPGHTHTFVYENPSLRSAMGTMVPRGMLVSGAGLVPSVSDGEGRIVPVESPEGQAILKSIAAPHAGMSRW